MKNFCKTVKSEQIQIYITLENKKGGNSNGKNNQVYGYISQIKKDS